MNESQLAYLVVILMVALTLVACLPALLAEQRKMREAEERQAVALEAVAEAAGSILDTHQAQAELALLALGDLAPRERKTDRVLEPPEDWAERARAAFCFKCGKIMEQCSCAKVSSSSTRV